MRMMNPSVMVFRLDLVVLKLAAEESTIARGHPHNSKGETLVEKIDKVDLERSKL